MKKRRLVCAVVWLLLSALLLPALYVGTLADEAAADATDATDAKVIRTAAEFEALHGDGSYRLGNDIDFGGKVYDRYVVPASFWGTLDGGGYALLNFSVRATEEGAGIFNMEYETEADGTAKTDEEGNPIAAAHIYTVSNLTVGSEAHPISVSSTSNRLGVFAGYVADGSVLRFTSVTVYAEITAEGQQVGGFLGRTMPNRLLEQSLFSDCAFYGTVTGKGANVSGFVGYSANPIRFEKCLNAGDITSDTTNVAGYVGVTYGAKYCALEFVDCRNTGRISGLNCIGGFIGKGQYTARFSRSVNEGEIAASGTHVGGFVGYEKNTTDYLSGVTVSFDGCTNRGAVSSTSAGATIGGLMGSAYDSVRAVDSVNEGKVTGGTFVGGILGCFNPQQTSDSYKQNEVFTFTATKCRNTGELVINCTGSGSCGGILGATSWSGIRSVAVVDMCTVSGALRDESAEEKTTASRMGGIVGRFDKEVGELTIKNSIVSATIAGTAVDTVSGILGYTNATVNSDGSDTELPEETNPVVRRIENCLLLGQLTRGGSTEKTAAMATNYAGDGTLVNCFYLAGTAEKAEFGESGARAVTAEELSGGEIALLLGSAFGQKLGEETLPSVGGNPVLRNAAGTLYNQIHTHDLADSPFERFNSGSHTRECKICGEKVREAHRYGEMQDAGDGTHFRVCGDCGFETSHQAHTESYTDNGETHTAVCSVCKATRTEAHRWDENGVCVCGAKKAAVSEEEETTGTPSGEQETKPSHAPGIYLVIGDCYIPLAVVIVVSVVLLAAVVFLAVWLIIKRRKRI
ncbi:MAG TPA: hypothetical protein DDW30_05905 [Clostridiales bacterium]|nr:hypothetical protein [Clostridiales bacterium]